MQGSLVFRKVGMLQERLLNSLSITNNATNRLSVEILRELEEESVVNSWLRLLFGLQDISMT